MPMWTQGNEGLRRLNLSTHLNNHTVQSVFIPLPPHPSFLKIETKKERRIGHVPYINILTWLRGFQTSIFGVVFLVFKSLLGIERKKSYNFDPKASEQCSNIYIERGLLIDTNPLDGLATRPPWGELPKAGAPPNAGAEPNEGAPPNKDPPAEGEWKGCGEPNPVVPGRESLHEAVMQKVLYKETLMESKCRL